MGTNQRYTRLPELAVSYGADHYGGDTQSDTMTRTVRIWNTTSGERTEYTLATDGQITKNSDLGSINRNDEISSDGTTVTGKVLDGYDAYDITGAITGFSWSGVEPTVAVDGVQVPPNQLVGYEAGDGSGDSSGGDSGGGDSGTGGAETGPFTTTLVGSNDTNNPKSGFGQAVRDAIDQDTPIIDVTGAWEYSNGIKFSSGQDTPDDLPVHIDARGASITFHGSGWAFTNDNTGDAGSALRGESFILEGGFWFASGNPDGFVRLIDTGGSHLYPQQTRNFRGSNSAIYQLEEGTRWAESNHLGGRHHLVDTGVRSKASQGTSFQDNLVDSIHLSNVSDYAFDLSGNWIDCTILNPTAIFNTNGAAFLRHNGNMGGTEIIAPEMEDATSDLSTFYLCEIGPRARKGPTVRGGDLGLNFNNITLFNTPSASGHWSFHMDYCDGFDQVRAWFSDDGATRRVLNGDGVTVETSSNVNDGWSTQGSL